MAGPADTPGAVNAPGAAELEQRILDLLDSRAATATICPSDVARSFGGADWRSLMEPTRQAARRLVAGDVVDLTQHGEVVDPATARGPIRIRRHRD